MTNKPKLTPEELSRKRSEAARKGLAARKAAGYANVGRKKGWTKDPALKAIPARTLTVREPDYQVVVKMANAMNLPIVEFMHRAAEKWKANNPRLFSPSATPTV